MNEDPIVRPAVTVAAIVERDDGAFLLVRERTKAGLRLNQPAGHLEPGESLAQGAARETLEEAVAREVKEETGIDCRVVQLLAVYDGLQRRFTSVPLYSLVFHCRATGGSLQAHPLETADVGFFALDDLPPMAVGADLWGPLAAHAFSGAVVDVHFDHPRTPVWQGDHLVVDLTDDTGDS